VWRKRRARRFWWWSRIDEGRSVAPEPW
jgi:hypothetical protein